MEPVDEPSGSGSTAIATRPRPGWRGPALLLAPLALWWCANVALWTLGVLDTDEWGQRAWREGFDGFPRWSHLPFALVGTAAWILGLLVVGALVTVHGRRAWLRLAPPAAALTVATPVLVVLATWTYPGG